MYKVTVTESGTTAAASKWCRTSQEAERIKEKLLQILKTPVQINVVHIGSTR